MKKILAQTRKLINKLDITAYIYIRLSTFFIDIFCLNLDFSSFSAHNFCHIDFICGYFQ